MVERFVLQVEVWGNWENDKHFHDVSHARQYAREQFPHNTWRVWDMHSRRSVCENDSLDAFQEEAARELDRFRSYNRFVERMRVNREERLERARRTRDHMMNITEQQRISDARIYDVDIFELFDEDDDVIASRVCWQKDGF